MWFVDSLKDLHQMLKWSRKTNSNFSDMKYPKERSVRKRILYPVLSERLLIFKYGSWAQTVLLSKYKFNSENIMYRVWCDFAKEGQRPRIIRDDPSRRYFRFRHCSTKVVLFSNTASENAQAFTSNVKSKCEGRLKISRRQFAKKPYLRQYSCSRHCPASVQLEIQNGSEKRKNNMFRKKTFRVVQ